LVAVEGDAQKTEHYLTHPLLPGKTLQCIALIWTLLKQGPFGKPVAKRVVVVCTGSLVRNWEKEFRKFLGQHRAGVFCISGNKKVSDYGATSAAVFPVSMGGASVWCVCLSVNARASPR
jgi:hypothetical protein